MTSTFACTDEIERERFKLFLAQDNGFVLYRQYTEVEAAKFLQLHPITLKKKRLGKEIAHLKKGRRSIAYLGVQLADYLITTIVPCPTLQVSNAIKSESTGSLNDHRTPTGVARGSTMSLDKRVVSRLALTALKKPKTD